MATLEQLEEQKRELEDRLASGDLTAESALTRIDAAIRARSRKIQHSQKRLAAVKQAVAKGVPVAEAKSVKARSGRKKKPTTTGPINRFE